MSAKLRGAVIGYGYIASKGHIPAYKERNDIEIVAIADSCSAREQQARSDTTEYTFTGCNQQSIFKNCRFYSNYQELLRQEAQNLDFVDIATPPAYHADIAKAALSAGLHVLCEKPLTTSVKNGWELLQMANDCQRVLFPVHNYKHAPVVKAIREVIDSGKIGVVRAMTLQTFRNTHALGIPEWHPNWRRELSYSGGGIAMDHGSHSFYLTFDWPDAYPLSISATLSNLEVNRYDTEDNFSATLTFPNAVANLYLTWTAGVRKVIYTVQGTKGAITVNDDDVEISTMQFPQNNSAGPANSVVKSIDSSQGYGGIKWETEKYTLSSKWMDSGHSTWFNSLFDQFMHAIKNNDYQNRELLEALLCIELIEKAYKSGKESSNQQVIDKRLLQILSDKRSASF